MTIIKFILFCLLIAFLFASCFFGYTPLLIPCLYLLMSIVTFVFYASDKKAAIQNEWRVPENTLQLFSLFGGWPGAIIAQQVLRHKNRKTSFQAAFWFVMLINTGALAWIHTAEGYSTLQGFLTALEKLIISEFGVNKISNAFLYLLQYRTYI